ncbi:MAG: carbonate dehydratase [Desulfobulbaceae bacterium]|jgi:carbonic anhydrase|nr:carbonate dehydratase [Desulfobulbaceae bacterium]
MRVLNHLFERNSHWAAGIKQADPDFFLKLSKQQKPEYLWIGCSDSRVPANQIVDLLPGEIFVHRNIANLVIHTDLNCLSVLQYAVEVLRIRHIIVCGHYGCGGIKAALEGGEHGLIDNWLRHIRDICRLHRARLEATADDREKFDLLCELNVREQVINICHTTIVRNAWSSGMELAVHGWIYSIGNGILKDLDLCTTGPEEVERLYAIS